ncbi:hypothetical protein Patl1_06991 [Pistacia atlantica]|uniref:Uncharacterized protein n=1 Tax=Pistacia atlantica TaxID=434234 RepID=A0ACC1AIK7_9ROSI|nr:hypothetical protein Patl1_06991 [Pistacia atlantica]
MAKEEAKAISLKALVDKENNRVIFAETDEDFTDVLFSFLTMPMGTIIRLLSNNNQPPPVGIGCMNNLYESIKNLDMLRFRNEACKTMLLWPKSGAAPQNKRLKLQIDDSELQRYFLCNRDCTLNTHKLLSLYPNAVCECGGLMDRTIELSENDNRQKSVFDARDRGVFVQGLTQFIISDELQVKPSSVEASLSVLSKLGYMDFSTIEEHNIDIGVDEVLTLLKCSLVSKKPLTKTLLKQISAPKFGEEEFDQNIYVQYKLQEPESNVDGNIHDKLDFDQNMYVESKIEELESNVDGKIHVKLIISKSKNMELDIEKYLKSNDHKDMLISPKLAPDFSYEKHPLGLEEALHPTYSYAEYGEIKYGFYYPTQFRLTSDGKIPSYWESSILTIKDPKSHFKEATRGGFVTGPKMFTLFDNLIITPVSQISSLSLLKKLKLPLSDIEVRVVHVGSEGASRLLMASFVSESALTNTFLRELNPGF